MVTDDGKITYVSAPEGVDEAFVLVKMEDLDKLQIQIDRVQPHYDRLIQGAKAGSVIHPWYGECDALGEEGGCAECQKTVRELQSRLEDAELDRKLFGEQSATLAAKLKRAEIRLDRALTALEGVEERCVGPHMPALMQLDTAKLCREVINDLRDDGGLET